MSIFDKKTNAAAGSVTKEGRRINAAVTNSFIAVAFTVVNIVLYVANADTYFLFSLYFPYVWFDPAIPADCVISLILLAAFGILAFLAKKKPGCLIGVLVLAVLDTLFLVRTIFALTNEGYVGVGDFLFDILFHIWLDVYLILGVASVKKYKEFLAAPEQYGDPQQYGAPQQSGEQNKTPTLNGEPYNGDQ